MVECSNSKAYIFFLSHSLKNQSKGKVEAMKCRSGTSGVFKHWVGRKSLVHIVGCSLILPTGVEDSMKDNGESLCVCVCLQAARAHKTQQITQQIRCARQIPN